MTQLLAHRFSYPRGAMEIHGPIICPNCQSSDLKKLSLVHDDGLHESRGRIRGLLLGTVDALILGKSWKTSQSRLSAMAAPPRKLPYFKPLILWLIGFVPIMAFAGRGRLSWIMALVAVAYVVLLPGYPLGALCYNLFVRPKKFKRWEGMFRCQRCGVVVERHSSQFSSLHA